MERDLYGVLGLKKECTPSELRNAYKKLAMKWHPDRCSAEEAKNKFQAVQQAYSVLSDANKRFLYDVGFYDYNDDDDQNGMGDFLSEMASIMNQNENTSTSFEDLQQLFEDIFQSDISREEEGGWWEKKQHKEGGKTTTRGATATATGTNQKTTS